MLVGAYHSRSLLLNGEPKLHESADGLRACSSTNTDRFCRAGSRSGTRNAPRAICGRLGGTGSVNPTSIGGTNASQDWPRLRLSGGAIFCLTFVDSRLPRSTVKTAGSWVRLAPYVLTRLVRSRRLTLDAGMKRIPGRRSRGATNG